MMDGAALSHVLSPSGSQAASPSVRTQTNRALCTTTASPRPRIQLRPTWLTKASEAHPPASVVEADLLQQRDEARLGTKRVVVMVNLDPRRKMVVAIIVGLFQQVERGPFVAEHRVYRCLAGRRNIDVR